MRIEQVAPLYGSCARQLYGGHRESGVVTDGRTVRQGHEVTLFASGDWASATGFALVQASLGIGFDQGADEIRFDRPMLPEFLDELHLRGLQARSGAADVELRRCDVALTITRRQGNVPIVVLG